MTEARQKRIGKRSLIFATIVSLVSVGSATISTVAWFQLTYVNKVTYSKASIVTTASNLEIEISTYAGNTIDGSAHQATGLNYWDVPFDGYLDDLSYNGYTSAPFYKLTWGSGQVGTSADSTENCSISAGSTYGFYLFKLTFKNDSTSNFIYVYLGPNSSLVAADNTTASSKAALCERVAIRTTASLGKNISYWVPNRNSGAMMLGRYQWSGASAAYGLASIYKGAPETTSTTENQRSPVNRYIPIEPEVWDTWSDTSPNIVHYGSFGNVTEGNTNCQDGQFVCRVPKKVDATKGSYSVYVLMWAEGTDEACTTAALLGHTTLNLEFIALSKQLWPAA